MEKEYEYDLDYDMFNVSEIIKIMEFFKLIESTKHKKVSKEKLVESYRVYQNILKNKALEKKYDKMIYEKSGVSIYQVMKNLI